jgi:hypothetical protein
MLSDSEYLEELHELFDQYLSVIEYEWSLFLAYKQAGIVYDRAHTLNKQQGYVHNDEIDHPSIWGIAVWMKDTVDNKWIRNLSIEEVAQGITGQMVKYFHELDEQNPKYRSPIVADRQKHSADEEERKVRPVLLTVITISTVAFVLSVVTWLITQQIIVAIIAFVGGSFLVLAALRGIGVLNQEDLGKLSELMQKLLRRPGSSA